jgi:hypothetical protein
MRSERSEKNVVERRQINAGPQHFFHASGWGFEELEDLAPRPCSQKVIPPFRTRARGAHQAAMAPKHAPEWDHAKNRVKGFQPPKTLNPKRFHSGSIQAGAFFSRPVRSAFRTSSTF